MTKIEKNKLILRTTVANSKGATEIWTSMDWFKTLS